MKKFVWKTIENSCKGKPHVYIVFSSCVVCSNRGIQLTCYALEYTCRVLGEFLEETLERMNSTYSSVHFRVSMSCLSSHRTYGQCCSPPRVKAEHDLLTLRFRQLFPLGPAPIEGIYSGVSEEPGVPTPMRHERWILCDDFIGRAPKICCFTVLHIIKNGYLKNELDLVWT